MNKNILKLAIPNVISNITVPLLGLVDLSIMGHLGSEKYIGAIALGTMIFNFIYLLFVFLRMSTSGFTAQAYGKRNFTESISWLSRALIASTIAGVTLIILQIPIERIAFNLIEGSSETEQLAIEYFKIRIWAAPAAISLYGITGWFIGMQNTKSPMLIAISINIVNVVANLFFVFVLEMKLEGVALGTLIAQYFGFFLSLFILRKYYSKLFKYFRKKAVLQVSELIKFAKLNSNILIRTISIMIVLTYFTSVSAKMGDDILAVNTLLLQFLMFFSYLIDGFAYAAEALSGKYYGAKNNKLLEKSIKYTFFWSFGVAILFSGIYFISFENILGLLTNNQGIIQEAMIYRFWAISIPVLSFVAFIWDGIYIGLTASKEMRNTMLLSTFVVFFPFYFLLKAEYVNHALWFALLAFLAARGVFQTIYARKIFTF